MPGSEVNMHRGPAWPGEESAMAEQMARSTNHATLRDKGKGKGGGGGGKWRTVEPRMAEVRQRGLLTPPWR